MVNKCNHCESTKHHQFYHKVRDDVFSYRWIDNVKIYRCYGCGDLIIDWEDFKNKKLEQKTMGSEL